jgi:superfamily I DNA/RNA helicase
VASINPADMMKSIEAGDFVLCRTTAPLVKTCLSLIRAGKAATVRGRDIGKGLIALTNKISKKRGNKSKELMAALSDWRQDQGNKFSAPEQENKLREAMDKVDTLIVLAEDCSTFDQLKARIEKIFANDNGDDTKNIILCSTVHKSKGLESPNVYVICPELLPGPWAKQDWQKQQEMNLKYVAITRAERNLFWVEGNKNER